MTPEQIERLRAWHKALVKDWRFESSFILIETLTVISRIFGINLEPKAISKIYLNGELISEV